MAWHWYAQPALQQKNYTAKIMAPISSAKIKLKCVFKFTAKKTCAKNSLQLKKWQQGRVPPVLCTLGSVTDTLKIKYYQIT